MGRCDNIGVAAFPATGSFLFGYDSGAMTDVNASPSFLEFSMDPRLPKLLVLSTALSLEAVCWITPLSPQGKLYTDLFFLTLD
jgi:hypothetical protein